MAEYGFVTNNITCKIEDLKGEEMKGKQSVAENEPIFFNAVSLQSKWAKCRRQLGLKYSITKKCSFPIDNVGSRKRYHLLNEVDKLVL